MKYGAKINYDKAIFLQKARVARTIPWILAEIIASAVL